MPAEYSLETCRALREAFRAAQVLRPMRIDRYDPGTELAYEMTGVAPARRATVALRVERFVGGGFAGQVYRAEVLSVEGEGIEHLAVGGHYAVKIFVPPSRPARKFRDAVYKIGFQAAFSLQVSPAAARAGAIWQKLIRRGAEIRLGGERAVVDVLATFFDERIGSCGEISEWVEGRNWRFEADNRLDARKRWRRGLAVLPDRLGSAEYRAKRVFMARLVELLHTMGAHELARQYEWWTAKSQPNVLKRLEDEADPEAGLTAVDFRAGLALLPCLPMSPVDVKLIFKGIARGSWVQFDRGDLNKLQRFVDAHAEQFDDLRDALAELKALERDYRESLPDVAHHHVRLLYSRRLWSRILDGMVSAWQARGLADEDAAARLRTSRLRALGFALLGLLPLAALGGGAALLIWAWAAGRLTWGFAALVAGVGVGASIVAGLLRRLWGRADLRRHYGQMLASVDYLRRAVRAHAAEELVRWHRAGAVSAERAMKLLNRPARFLAHAVFFSWMPSLLHRALTDRRFAWGRLKSAVTRVVRLYFSPQAREQWLREMVAEGRRNGMLTDQEAEHITARVKEPFIQKYLKSLAVHLCTLPITQVVSVAVAIYVALTYGKTWQAAWTYALEVLALFQVTPISPGSIARGLYVVWLVLRERNFKDYNIAVFLAFFKYVGYLAFPVQMAYRYPALARFMAGRWATGAVHFVPVFGERGALLEHGIFDAFYNRLLTLRRRFGEKDDKRRVLPARRWHLPVCAIGGLALLVLIDWLYVRFHGTVPSLPAIWYLAVWPAMLAGSAAGIFSAGTSVGRRILLAAAVGAGLGAAYGASNTGMGVFIWPRPEAPGEGAAIAGAFAAAALWRVFLFSILAALAAFLAETRLPGPQPPAAAPA